MLGFIREWVIQISAVIIFASVCEAIMPNNGIKKYVNTVLGIILVLTVVTPIASGFSGDSRFYLSDINKYNAYVSKLNMDEVQKEQVTKIYNRKLCEKIKESIKTVSGDVNAEVIVEIETENAECFGEIKHIIVTADALDKNEENKIFQVIRNNYGVDKENIELRG